MVQALLIALLYSNVFVLASNADTCKQGVYKDLVPHIAQIAEAREFCRVQYPSGSQNNVRSPQKTTDQSQDPVWKKVKAKAGPVLRQICRCVQQTPVETPEKSACDACSKPKNPYCPNGRCRCDFTYHYGKRLGSSGLSKSGEKQKTSLETCARECDDAGNTCVAVEFDCKTKSCGLYSKVGLSGTVPDASNRYAIALKSNCRNKDAKCQPPAQQPVCTELAGLPGQFSDTSCSCSYTYTDNTNADANTASPLALSQSSLEACARSCDNASLRVCEAFSYNCTKPIGSNVNCILYGRRDPTVPVRSTPQSGFVYGARGTCRDGTCQANLCPRIQETRLQGAGTCGCTYTINRDRGVNSVSEGGQVTTVTSSSLEACAAACDNQPDCAGADYSCERKVCLLFTGIGDTAQYPNRLFLSRSNCAATCRTKAEPTCPSIANAPATVPNTSCGCTYTYSSGNVIRGAARRGSYYSQGTLEICSRVADQDADVAAWEYDCKNQDCIFYSKLPAGEPVRVSSNPDFIFVSRNSCRSATCQNNT